MNKNSTRNKRCRYSALDDRICQRGT